MCTYNKEMYGIEKAPSTKAVFLLNRNEFPLPSHAYTAIKIQ